MKLIDKEKVVAEIERVLNSYDPNEITSGRYALADLRDFINTLEVKEVDLEVEDAFIDKACKWLKFNYTEYLNDTRIGIDIDEMVNDFKMDMKGE